MPGSASKASPPDGRPCLNADRLHWCRQRHPAGRLRAGILARQDASTIVSRVLLVLIFVIQPVTTLARRAFSRAAQTASDLEPARPQGQGELRHAANGTLGEIDPSWSLGRTWLATCAALLGVMLFIGRDLYFGVPLHEIADLAANALQIDRAKELGEIYGNYSRFGFNHPGPAFFYVYAGAEILFHDLLRLTPAPHNAHLLGGILLQSSFLALAITVLARYASPNRVLFIALAIGIGLLHFALAGQHQYSIWPPSALVLPFASFLVLATALSAGWIGILPLMVLVGGFLVHGHVAQPLFVLAIGLTAYATGVWRRSREARVPASVMAWRQGSIHLMALAVLAVFLLPLLIDASLGENSNAARIFRFLVATREPGDNYSPAHVVGYVISFFGYPTALGELDFQPRALLNFVLRNSLAFATLFLLIVVAPIARLLIPALHGRAPTPGWRPVAVQPLGTLWVFLGLALGLTVVWVLIQRGPLYQFNSLFVYGLIYVAMLPGALLACQRFKPAGARIAATVLGVAVIAMAVSTESPGHGAEDPTLADATNAFVAESPPPAAGVLLSFEGMHWNAPAAVALALERLDVPWFVAPGWGWIFGYGHEYQPGLATPEPVRWSLAPPSSDHEGQITLSDAVAIYPPPIGLTGPASPP